MFSVNPAQIENFAHTLEQTSRDISNALDGLDRISDHLHMSWEGQTATAQREAHDRNRRDLDEMHKNLELIVRNTRAAHTNYTNAIRMQQLLTDH